MSIPILLAAVPIVACLVGWGLDRALGTFPWFTVVLLMLGFLGGARELWMAAKRFDEDETQPPNRPS